MVCTVVVDGFFGDTGKGKVVSFLAWADRPKIAARGGVGPNAGHTVVFGDHVYKLRMVPSAFVSPTTRLLIGPGVLVNPDVLLSEIELTGCADRLGVDPQCAIIEQKHIEADKTSSYLSGVIGTTGTGCGPAMEDRVARRAKLVKDEPRLQKFLTDVPLEVNEAVDEGEDVILEGTQGTFLSLWHGTYPFVTSKDVTASSICADVGVGPKKVDEVVVVLKSFVTRVGGGPLPGELSPEEVEKRGWMEIASVTGRRRRVAEFNFELAKRAVMLNSATQIALTKLDLVIPDCKGITSYDKLPRKAKKFVEEIEEALKTPVTLIGTGPSTHEMIDRREAS